MRKLLIRVLMLLVMGANAYSQKIVYDKPDFILHIAPEDSNDGFGYGKAFGRFNNDNYDDLVVLAPHYHNAKGEKVGKAYIYYGTSFGIDTTVHLEIEGIYKCDEDVFGLHSLAIGDYNADGLDDLALGTLWYQRYNLYNARGYVVVFLSKADGSGIKLEEYIELMGFISYGRFAANMRTADVNGDKIDDLVISANEDGGASAGRIYIYYGKYNFDKNYNKVLKSNNGRNDLYCTGAGDINGDNFDDIIGWDNINWNRAKAQLHVWLGGNDMIQTPNYSREMPYIWPRRVCDLNNDLYADIIISSGYFPHSWEDPNVSPNLTILKGASNFNINAEIKIFLKGHHSWISGVKDINDDNLNEIFIDIRDINDYGTTYVFSGDETKYVDISDTLLQFIDSDPSYGLSVTGVIPADMNGDGEYEYYTNSQMKPYKDVIFIYNAKFPTLALTLPNTAGTEWKTGKEYTINWDSRGNVGPTVKLELFKGSQLHRIIAENTDNDGAHKWTVPPELPTGSDFKIKISSVLDATIYDFNDHFFTITQVPNLKITYPDSAGIVWYGNNTYTIRWQSWGQVGPHVKLEIYKDNRFFKIINYSANNEGSYARTITSEDCAGNNCKIKITSVSDDSVHDFSDYPLAIYATVTVAENLAHHSTNRLHPCYPNPFNATLTIHYEISQLSEVNIRIFDLLGKVVRTLVYTEQSPGIYAIDWNGRDDLEKMVSSGIYILEMQAGDFVARQKITLLK